MGSAPIIVILAPLLQLDPTMTSAPPIDKRFPGWLILLGVLTAIGPLSIDMYLPSFPLIEHSLGGHPGSVELTLASFFIGLTLGQLSYGPLSDRFGRKKPLYVGLVIYTIASIGAALADSIPMLTLWRFLQGMGGCAGIIIPSAIVRDRSTARESARAFSLLMLVMGLAPILAPLIGGGLLTLGGWRSIFCVLALFGAGCLIAIHLGLAESHDTRHEPPLKLRTVLGNYLHLMRNKAFLGYALGGGLAMSGMFAYIAGSPFVLIELYDIPPQNYGWFFGANAFGLIASSQINARLLKKLPATTLLRRALWVPAVAGITLAGLAFSGLISLPWFVFGFFCFVSSLGCIIPNAMASALATHGQQAGTAAALASALQFFFATLAGALVGLLHDGTGRPLAAIMALCGVGAWLCHRLLVTHHETHHHNDQQSAASAIIVGDVEAKANT
jgi:DHA1 family bicyclomycin/chloramphenicol resistance-like MFS transporter